MIRQASITAALLAVAGLAGCIDYSDGERVGRVIKFSKKGLFCKTWEGEMLLGGLKRRTSTDSDGNTSSTMAVNTFAFTVEDARIVPRIAAALESGEPLRLAYRQELFTACRSHSNYFITEVKGAPR